MSDESEVWDLGDVTPKEVNLKIAGKTYVLREAKGGVGAKIRSFSARCARWNDGGKMDHVDGIGDVEPYALSLSLFEQLEITSKNGHKERPVPIQTILAWTDKVMQQLYDKLCEITPSLRPKDKEKERKEQEAAKNLLNGSTDGFEPQESLDEIPSS